MPISDKHKVIFLHIPKTGGTSIEKFLDIKPSASTFYSQYLPLSISVAAPQHLPYADLKAKLPVDKWVTYYKFAIVRNPWERLLSTYKWKSRGCKTFEEFVFFVDLLFKKYKPADLHYYSDYQRNWCSHLLPQSMYIGDDVHVYRFEHFNEIVDDLKQRLGLGEEIKKVNGSDHDHYSHYYTKKLRETVARIYADDIERFGYEFEVQYF